eukprot:TRINITY_DN13_c0_g1_i2.p1 TRINITY_DN13_c0_g1~~TRINITY_DN13_c0_g1_i2.p1  ORF type:complete len:465 (-),score=158.76 TRINITY_DN13_c0_g1_i2:214-1608(-)
MVKAKVPAVLALCLFALVVSVPVDLNAQERLLAVSEVVGSSSQVSLNEEPVDAPEPQGINTAMCWRVRSLVRSNGPRPGFEWSVSKLELYTSSDGSGEALTGEAYTSSQKEKTANKPDNAFNGNEDTQWQANGMDSGEYIGLKLPEAKEVRSLKIMQVDEQHAVKQAVLEKSLNCETWARVAEFPEMTHSFANAELYRFASVDKIPNGVFQIRSRINVNRCIGVTPDEDEAQDIADGLPQKSATPGSALVVQMCNVDVLPQFWSFDQQGQLVNAALENSLLQVQLDDAAALLNEAAVTLGACTTDECAGLKSALRYNEGNGDGLLLPKAAPSLVLAPVGGSLAEGTALQMVDCAKQGTDAVIAECADKSSAQWDVPPMFTIETGKKAQNCAPYSHMNPDEQKPIAANTRLAAQKACAADRACKVYMWADEATGDDADKAWLCQALDIVYSGKQGYELGFRVSGD